MADAAASLLAELSPRLRAAIDTSVLAWLEPAERDAVEHLARTTGSHVVAYDLRIAGAGLALCAAVRQADLHPDQLGALRAVERELAPWIALVAYARPATLRTA